MIQPKISVVTVCYNAVNDIEKTILSVINQTYPNIEYLIIDGGSKDGTMDIVNKYKDKIDVIVSEPDKGIYDAMNKGIGRATGEWINFMNAGDYFYTDSVLDSIKFASISDNVNVIYGDIFLKKSNVVKKAENLRVISHMMPFCHQASFARLSLVHFDVSLKIAADYELFYDMYYKEGKDSFEYVSEVISVFEENNGISSKAIKELQNETLAVMSKRKSLWYYYLLIKLYVVRYLKND